MNKKQQDRPVDLVKKLSELMQEQQLAMGESDNLAFLEQDWNLSEWLQLNCLLDELLKDQGHVFHAVLEKMKLQFSQHPAYNSYLVLKEKLDQIDVMPEDFLSDPQLLEENLLLEGLIESSIKNRKCLKVLPLHSSKTVMAYPFRLLLLNGDKTIIAEDINDHCLIAIDLADVDHLQEMDMNYKQKVSDYEIEEFSHGLHAMYQQETRLIIKINNPEMVRLDQALPFLNRPTIVTNPKGEIIWSAYVEVGVDLFEWMLSLHSYIEIIGPNSLKQEFLFYCEEKLQKIS